MNYCSCNHCNGIYPEVENEPAPEELEEVEPPKSVYDRIGDLHTQLCLTLETEDAGLLDELLSIHEEVDNIDSKIIELQKQVTDNPKEYIQVQLGEVSKKLY